MSKDKREERRNRKVRNRAHSSAPYRPAPPRAAPEVVWEKVETLVAAETTPSTSTGKTSEPTKRKRGEHRRRRRWRRKLLTLDILGAVIWTFVFTKLFVADFDRMILGSIAPEALWVLDLRGILVLALFALVLLLLKARTLGFAAAYVAGFPLVLLLWKLPKFLVERRSATLTSTFAALVTGVASRARLFIVALAIACLSGTAILSGDTTLIAVGIIGMLVALVWWIVITGIDLLHSSAFIRAQAAAINFVFGNHHLERFVTPEQPDQIMLNTWTAQDATKFRDTAGYAVLARRALLLWASAVSQFRRAPTALLLNACIFVVLFIQLVVVSAFVNYGLFTIDPTQFTYTTTPDWLTFTNYAVTAIAFGEISALTPAFGWAVGVKVFMGVLGSLGVVTIIGSSFLAYRHARSDRESDDAVDALLTKADTLRDLSEGQFQMSIEDLQQKLLATGWGMLRLVEWMREKTTLSDIDR